MTPLDERRAAGRTGRRAVAHDFFVTEGGADHVAIEFSRILPDAEVWTSFFNAARFAGRIDPRRVHTWPLQRIGPAMRHFRSLLPLYPLYFTMLRIGRVDLVLSSSIAFTHAIRVQRPGRHICYVHTPMRYAWALDEYVKGSSLSLPARVGARTIRPLLQRWDRGTAARPDVLVANSRTVQERIRRFWGRDAAVIYPPVDVDAFRPTRDHDGYFLVAARLVAYRRVDLAVRACTALGVPLVVVGDGPERARLKAMAGPTVAFVGHLDRASLVDRFERCRGYLVPGVEDFGIAPVEAMAAGKPVIAFRSGGVTETVVEGMTGLFFDEPTEASLRSALEAALAADFDPAACRARAELFSLERFRRAWIELLGV